MTEIEEYASFVKSSDTSKGFGTPEHNHQFSKKFGVKYFSCGISRTVFKKRYSREVIKVCSSQSNLAEYALYRAFDGCQMQSLLAKCIAISKDGTVLIQEYLPKSIPDYALGGSVDDTRDWAELQDYLEAQFSFIKNFTKDKYTICDMHCDNIRANSKHDLKIIDYAAPLDTIVRQKNFDLEACIQKLSRYTKRHDQKIKFYLNASKQIVLDLGTELIKMPPSKHLTA